jgi:hypothetical protein
MTPTELESFKNWGVPLPDRQPHGTDDEVRANMQSLKPTNWRQQGNRLIADTEVGELSQTIPTDYILVGTDDKGLPKFKRI